MKKIKKYFENSKEANEKALNLIKEFYSENLCNILQVLLIERSTISQMNELILTISSSK